MKIVIRGHPAKRMAERGVTLEQLKFALEEPDFTMPGASGGRCCYVRRFEDGRRLKVWTTSPIDPETFRVTVKSVAWW